MRLRLPLQLLYSKLQLPVDHLHLFLFRFVLLESLHLALKALDVLYGRFEYRALIRADIPYDFEVGVVVFRQ